MKTKTLLNSRHFLFVIAALVGLTNNALAGTCGKGYITEVSEGAHNLSGLMIKIDYSVAQSTHAGTETYTYIRYPTTLPADRLRAIRSMAMLAFTSDLKVNTWSHVGDCSSATELALIGR